MSVLAIVIASIIGYLGLAGATGYMLGKTFFIKDADDRLSVTAFLCLCPLGFVVAVGWMLADAGQARRKALDAEAKRVNELEAIRHRINVEALLDQEKELKRLGS